MNGIDDGNAHSGRASSVALWSALLVAGIGIAWWSLDDVQRAPVESARGPRATGEVATSNAAPSIEVGSDHDAPREEEPEEEPEAREEVYAEIAEEVFEEPVLKDAEITDHNETEEGHDFMASEGDPDFISDSPFDDTNLNDVIGVGGGSGGKYGGRFGGRRNLKTQGGKAVLGSRDAAPPEWAGETYQGYATAGFLRATEHPLSTFSIDVDRASYTNARRMIEAGALPPAAAVRVEEFVNHFDYAYGRPEGEAPLALAVEVAACPWRPENRLVRVSLASRALEEETRQPRNLVFLVDVSGSMKDADKLPLFKRGLRMLVGELDERDSISIVTYASGMRVALEPTTGDQQTRILGALDDLEAGGSTNGAGGIQLAYECAAGSFIEGGVNRVLLGTDGDFNVGIKSRAELVKLIEAKRESGVFLTVLGFGEGNLKDANLEQIANKGNGHYLYVDSMREARRVFVEEAGANLVTVAKDVKLQVEFNPLEVDSYRLVGYANRKLAARDFNDDGVDAGEVGAGHGVTAFYEVVPARRPNLAGVDDLRYQRPTFEPTEHGASGELLTVKLRYKLPDEDRSRRVAQVAEDEGAAFEAASPDFRFAAAAALFGEVLARSPHITGAHFDRVLALLEDVVVDDPSGQRTELFDLVLKAQELLAE